jgi:hypothetical protein
MADFPESYKHPLYASLDSANERKHDLPVGMLSSVREMGERTNASQVSTAKATTPYQFIPATRKAILDKYGIDVTLSPENASEGAALLLQESLKRNSGAPEQAIREYHGGTDRAAWGKQNDAYWTRVAVGMQKAKTGALENDFAKWMAANPATPQAAGPVEPASQADKPNDVLAAGFGEWLQKQPATQPENAVPAPGVTDRIAELPGQVVESITGTKRQTDATNALPDWATMPELNSFSMASAKTGLGTFLSNPQETVQVIQSNFPGVQVRQDGSGNFLLRSSIDGQEYAIKPGFSVSDIPRAVGGIAAFTPAGRAGSVIGAGLKSAGTQVAIEGTQAATGGEFNPGDVALAGGMGAAVPAVVNAVRGVGSQARQMLQRVRGEPAPAMPSAPAGSAIAPEAAAAAPEVPTYATAVPEPATAPGAPAGPVAAAEAAPAAGAMDPEKLAATARTAATGGFGSKKATQTLAEQAAPDPETVAAAQRLGVLDHLQPDHYTTNQAYRQLAQLVKSQTGSPAAMAQREGLLKVAEKADDLITQMGGSSDLSTLSSNAAVKMNATNVQLKAQASKLYDEVDKAIGSASPAPAPNIVQLIKDNAKKLGGEENLPAVERDLLKRLSPKENGTQPTYALLDKLRKDIGEAKRGKQNAFGTSNTYELGQLETALRADQKAIATVAGVGEKWELAQATSAAYKGVQDDLKAIYGKELEKSMAPLLTGAVKDLSKGDTARFIKLLRSTPEDMRQEVAASGLASFFQRTSRGGEMDFAGYARWFEGVQQNKQAYTALMVNLPPQAHTQLRDLARVARGIATSKGEFIATGKALNPKVLEAADNLMSRVFEVVRQRGMAGLAAEAAGTMSGVPGLATALQSAMAANKPTAAKAVDSLITSSEFAHAVQAVGKPEQRAATRRLAYSKPFTKFVLASGKPRELSNRERWILQAMQGQNQDRAAGGPQK